MATPLTVQFLQPSFVLTRRNTVNVGLCVIDATKPLGRVVNVKGW